jgi:hypothetical protein
MIYLADQKEFYQEEVFAKNNHALACSFSIIGSKNSFVVGNTHLEYHPELDFVKHAQA